MSNPYDPNAGNNNPYGGSDPSGSGGYGGYGNTGGNTGGGGGYGAPYGQPASPYDEGPKKTDAVSIVGFVLSLTCCLSIVGAILGFVGLSRTKGGKRKGRWAAIAAAIIGTLLTIAVAIGGTFLAIYIKSGITIEEAKVGQCLNVDEGDDQDVFLREKDCTESHDGEIVAVAKFGDVSQSALQGIGSDPSSTEAARQICTSLLDDDAKAKLDDTYEFGVVSEDESSPSANEKFVCYVTLDDGGKLSEKLLP
jgi:hypothetical protein